MKTTKSIVFFLLFISIIGCSCGIVQKLSFNRQDYLSNELRTDGFYYSDTKNSFFILYRNGVTIFSGGPYQAKSYIDVENYISDYKRFKFTYDTQYYWGIFKVEKPIIIIETWMSGDAFAGYSTMQVNGKILNDSTIEVTKPYNAIFRFYKLHHKPDSTNVFVK